MIYELYCALDVAEHGNLAFAVEVPCTALSHNEHHIMNITEQTSLAKYTATLRYQHESAVPACNTSNKGDRE